MNHPLVKVCGMTQIKQVAELKELGVDYAGFICYPASSRYMVDKIAADELKSIKDIKKVGVFVNAAADEVLKTIDSYGLDAVQLHGDEPPELLKTLKGKTTVIKALRISGQEDINREVSPFLEFADAFLFDTKAAVYGGTGRKFDWSLLHSLSASTPYFLSGGIGPDDVEEIKAFEKKQPLFAVDVNSKFETAPGIKNREAIAEFLAAYKK